MYTLILGRRFSVKDVVLNSFKIEKIVTNRNHDYSYLLKDRKVVAFENEFNIYVELFENIYNIQDEGGHFAAEVMNVIDAYNRKEEWATDTIYAICEKIEQMVDKIVEQNVELNEEFSSGSDRVKSDLIKQYKFMLFGMIRNENWNDLIVKSFREFISKDHRRPNGCPRSYLQDNFEY